MLVPLRTSRQVVGDFQRALKQFKIVPYVLESKSKLVPTSEHGGEGGEQHLILDSSTSKYRWLLRLQSGPGATMCSIPQVKDIARVAT